MSRVFEALNKAREEKREQSEKPKEGDGTVAQEDSGKKAAFDFNVSLGSNGQAHQAPPSPSSSFAIKSWRERFEELVFGRDLRRYKSYPIVVLESGSPAAEQFKILREQIKRLRGERGARAISITSPVKQDGKTSVSVNLSAAMALEGEQVLLIDCDLRSPQIHRYFGYQRGPGLSDYLALDNNSDDIAQYARETFVSGLKILTAGKPSNLSSELLAKLKTQGLMEEILAKFPDHQIVVDTPPILSTADPLILAREVDGVIMVIRAHKTPRDYLLKAVQSLNSNKLMGIVLNDVELGIIGSKYYYYYPSTHN